MRFWRASLVITPTVFATLAVVGGVLARNGLAAVGEPLTAAEEQVLYLARKAAVALSADDCRTGPSDQAAARQSVAGEYLEHCAMCHGRAGRGDPTLTAMPGWSATHDSHELWRYVAFVRQLPQLDERAILRRRWPAFSIGGGASGRLTDDNHQLAHSVRCLEVCMQHGWQPPLCGGCRRCSINLQRNARGP